MKTSPTFQLGLLLIASGLVRFVETTHAITAFVNPAGSYAPFDGVPTGLISLGMDFDVHQPVKVTKLGVFDFGQDGVFQHTLEVGVFDRDTGMLVGSPMVFKTDSPGLLDLGSRFKSITQPFVLAAGFHGSIVAFGYSSTAAGDGEPFVDEYNNHPVPQSVDDGGGLISFHASRYEVGSSLVYPGTIDNWLIHSQHAHNQYMAGTFQFEAKQVPDRAHHLEAIAVAFLFAFGFCSKLKQRVTD